MIYMEDYYLFLKIHIHQEKEKLWQLLQARQRQLKTARTTRCTRGDARSFFCTYKTYLYAQNYFRKNKFKYCFKSYIKLHEYANCNSANYDV